ncbi:hypothetical protein ACFS07_10570 [Undibacterium arcticum]
MLKDNKKTPTFLHVRRVSQRTANRPSGGDRSIAEANMTQRNRSVWQSGKLMRNAGVDLRRARWRRLRPINAGYDEYTPTYIVVIPQLNEWKLSHTGQEYF